MAVVPVYQHKKLYETFWRLVNRQPRTAPFVWQIGFFKAVFQGGQGLCGGFEDDFGSVAEGVQDAE
jgi:hypothetical protein